MSENNERPLWMPIGSVRSLLALAIVIAFVAGSGYLVVTAANSDLTKLIVGGWLATVGTVIKDYFNMRQQGDGS